MSTTPQRNCGTCRYYNLDRQFCRRYPPQAVDNRHVRYPRTQFDDSCGEHGWRDDLLVAPKRFTCS